jgi:hypothetical protein
MNNIFKKIKHFIKKLDILTILGVMMMFLIFFIGYITIEDHLNKEEIEGIVTNVNDRVENYKSCHKGICHPAKRIVFDTTVSFNANNSNSSKEFSIHRNYDVGDMIKILIDKNNPQNYIDKPSFVNKLVILVILGLFCASAAVGGIVRQMMT